MSEYPFYIDPYDYEKYIVEQEDIIVAKGGDGTLLKAINIHKDKLKPFFGIAAGTVNFLMNKEDKVLRNAKHKSFRLIKVRVEYFDYNTKRIETKTYQAFNDIIIGGDLNSYIHFNIKDKDEIIGKFSGGGIIFSTAQGSTGINKNNHGFISPLESLHWHVTGVLSNRNINYSIEPRKTIINFNSRTPVTVWVDGQNNIIKDVKKVTLTQGDQVQVIFNNYKSFKQKRRM